MNSTDEYDTGFGIGGWFSDHKRILAAGDQDLEEPLGEGPVAGYVFTFLCRSLALVHLRLDRWGCACDSRELCYAVAGGYVIIFQAAVQGIGQCSQ